MHQPDPRPASTPAYVAVIGPGDATPDETRVAAEVGRLLAERGAVVVCGGHGGIMEAVCQGAYLHGGLTVGLLPGPDHGAGNRYLTVELPTGLGQLRNALVVGCAEAVIAVGGSWGTFSEVALAMRAGKPTFSLNGWDVTAGPGTPVPQRMGSAEEAVDAALAAVRHQAHRAP
ncbi:MAG TPA: TIGR00725 family protein [Streptosporangiaceae bacterium]|nr:TIGR00725 family protein [Streptosporangiaceae bacterium]